MKKRNLVSLLLVVLMLVSMASAALAADPWKGKRLGVAHITMYDEWCKAVYDEFMAQAPAMGFAEINIQDGNLNAETQQKQIEDFIAQKYDAILTDPVNGEGVVPTLELAGAANIPVFAFDNGTIYDKLITHVAWDHAQTGVLTAKWVADYAKEHLGGKVKMGMLEMLYSVHTQVRSEAFKKTLIELLGEENITWVFEQDFGETRESAANIVTNNIAKPIDVIWGAVDNAAMGAANALELAGAEGTIVVSAGAWGSEPFNMINNNHKYYKMCIGVSAANIVKLTLESVQKYFAGEELPKEQNIELAVIDATTIADYMKYVQ
ncbi:MAG: sugar ABC transporter substrate-binding protein [Clostridiales bacterium]|nr:sugar ABC transporter substrate-binding protein [Clostridiales bacterium]